uniref:Phosphatidylserine decarboxylase proenzyme, mitochondrial n=1 Tax=Syphacia muris TaxID=451379 RepID=A0A158R455_9BILA
MTNVTIADIHGNSKTVMNNTGRYLAFCDQKHNYQSLNDSNCAGRRTAFWRYTTWFGITFIVAGSSFYLLELFLPDARVVQDSKHYYSTLKMRAYCSLPLNTLSRFAGGIARIYIPVWLRPTLLGLYARLFNCRMDEALVEDFRMYPTLASFFNRELKPSVRPISDAELVSPADGVVVHYGKVENGKIEFVKGQDYALSEFLGPIDLSEKFENLKKVSYFLLFHFSIFVFANSCVYAGITELYQVVIYLAPGEYHAFHSPARWTVKQEFHYPGLLLSVRPALLDQLPRLFCMNERVVLNGQWKHGFFSLSAIAATNVGDVIIDADPDLHTNLKRIRRKLQDESTGIRTDINYDYFAGQRVGEFRLGSTVVLVFESPKSIEFAFKAGDYLRYGQSLIKADL